MMIIVIENQANVAIELAVFRFSNTMAWHGGRRSGGGELGMHPEDRILMASKQDPCPGFGFNGAQLRFTRVNSARPL